MLLAFIIPQSAYWGIFGAMPISYAKHLRKYGTISHLYFNYNAKALSFKFFR